MSAIFRHAPRTWLMSHMRPQILTTDKTSLQNSLDFSFRMNEKLLRWKKIVIPYIIRRNVYKQIYKIFHPTYVSIWMFKQVLNWSNKKMEKRKKKDRNTEIISNVRYRLFKRSENVHYFMFQVKCSIKTLEIFALWSLCTHLMNQLAQRESLLFFLLWNFT